MLSYLLVQIVSEDYRNDPVRVQSQIYLTPTHYITHVHSSYQGSLTIITSTLQLTRRTSPLFPYLPSRENHTPSMQYSTNNNFPLASLITIVPLLVAQSPIKTSSGDVLQSIIYTRLGDWQWMGLIVNGRYGVARQQVMTKCIHQTPSCTDGRVVKAEDLSPSAVMRAGSIPALCTFLTTFNFLQSDSPTLISLYQRTHTNHMNDKVMIGRGNDKHINAYIEYCNLVGDNGGKLMDEKEYQLYKNNYDKLSANRVFCSWVNPNGLECKVVGPSTKCFCDHYFKNHDFLEAKDNKVKCKQSGCTCGNYAYLPTYGSQDFKCSCKHSYSLHQNNKRNCKSCACKEFTSSWKCSCGFKFTEHTNLVQRREEREKVGKSSHPINGGIVSYSSMLEGADRHGNQVDEYLNEHPDKVTKVQEMKLAKNVKVEEDPKVNAFELYNTPLRW